MRALTILVLIAAFTSTAFAENRTITVTGESRVTVTPDHALLRASVTDIAGDAADAQRRVEKITATLIEALESLTVNADTLNTAQLTVTPRYRWQRDRQEQVFEGYEVTQTISVILEDLQQLGSAYQRWITLGATRVEPAQLRSYQAASAALAAQQQALMNARRQAEALASTARMGLGKALHIDTTNAPGRPPILAMSRMAAESDALPAYEPGQLEISAQVRVVFELEETAQ